MMFQKNIIISKAMNGLLTFNNNPYIPVSVVSDLEASKHTLRFK